MKEMSSRMLFSKKKAYLWWRRSLRCERHVEFERVQDLHDRILYRRAREYTRWYSIYSGDLHHICTWAMFNFTGSRPHLNRHIIYHQQSNHLLPGLIRIHHLRHDWRHHLDHSKVGLSEAQTPKYSFHCLDILLMMDKAYLLQSKCLLDFLLIVEKLFHAFFRDALDPQSSVWIVE